MKQSSLLLALMVSFLFACQKNAEDTRLLPPSLTSTRSADSVHLHINAIFGFLPILPYTYVAPDKFEIYESRGNMNSFEKIAAIDNDGTYQYPIGGLETGDTYFYYVKSKKSGLETVYSDTIMVIPTVPEVRIRVTNPTDFPIYCASLSPDGKTLAYANPAYTWDNGMYGAISLFLLDFATGESSIVQRSAVFPDWSPTGDKIVFCTDKDETGVPGYRPQQLALFDLPTNTISRLTEGTVFTLHPEFSTDGQWIVFASDEGHANEFDIWKMAADGTQKTQLTNGLGHDHYSSSECVGMPVWSPDGSAIYYSVFSNDPNKDGIFKINTDNNSIVPVLQSQWEDSSPSISPDGKRMAFFSNRSGFPEVWVLDMETGKYHQITGFTGGTVNNSWSKIEWINEAELLFGGIDGTPNEMIYRVKL